MVATNRTQELRRSDGSVKTLPFRFGSYRKSYNSKPFRWKGIFKTQTVNHNVGDMLLCVKISTHTHKHKCKRIILIFIAFLPTVNKVSSFKAYMHVYVNKPYTRICLKLPPNVGWYNSYHNTMPLYDIFSKSTRSDWPSDVPMLHIFKLETLPNWRFQPHFQLIFWWFKNGGWTFNEGNPTLKGFNSRNWRWFLPSDLFGRFKWPFSRVKWPPFGKKLGDGSVFFPGNLGDLNLHWSHGQIISTRNFGGSGSSGSTSLRHVHVFYFQTKLKENKFEIHESSVTPSSNHIN